MSGYPNKTNMPIELFRIGDVVSPSCGFLTGVRGVVAEIDRYVTIQFSRPVQKYPQDPSKGFRTCWRYEASNVRLEALARRKPSVKKDR